MATGIVDADGDTYRDLTADGLTLLYFRTEWSEECKALEPALADLAAEHPDLLVARIDADDDGRVMDEFGVESVPATVLFEDGEPVEVFESGLPFPALDRELLRRTP